MGSTAPETTSSKQRFIWADVIRGICIILVVSAHVTVQWYVHVDFPEAAKSAWVWFNKGFAPMRLPLFFLVSGFLAASAINRPWRLVVRNRVATPYYLYVLWAIPLPLLYASLDSDVLYGRIESVWDALKVLFIPDSSLWYLFALAVYFGVAKSLAKAPKILVLVAVTVFSMCVSMWGGDSVLAGVGHYPAFYLLGAFFPSAVKALAATRGNRPIILAMIAYCAVLGTYVVDLQNVFGIRTLCGAVGAVAFLVLISRSTGIMGSVGAGLAKLGAKTLPIFILHYPILALIGVLLAASAGSIPMLLAGALPALLTIFLVTTSLAVYRVLMYLSLGFLFELPGGRAAAKSSHVGVHGEVGQTERRLP